MNTNNMKQLAMQCVMHLKKEAEMQLMYGSAKPLIKKIKQGCFASPQARHLQALKAREQALSAVSTTDAMSTESQAEELGCQISPLEVKADPKRFNFSGENREVVKSNSNSKAQKTKKNIKNKTKVKRAIKKGAAKQAGQKKLGRKRQIRKAKTLPLKLKSARVARRAKLRSPRGAGRKLFREQSDQQEALCLEELL